MQYKFTIKERAVVYINDYVKEEYVKPDYFKQYEERAKEYFAHPDPAPQPPKPKGKRKRKVDSWEGCEVVVKL